MATLCLLHGAWHDSSCWAPVAQALAGRGHEVLAPDLPFDDPRTSYEDRAAPALAALDGTESPVVVGHSRASELAALIAAARPCALVVHLCPRLGPFAVPGAPRTFRAGFPFPPDRPDGTSVWDPDAAIAAMYGRLDPATAQALARRLRALAPAAGPYPLTEHPDVAAALVYAADDEFFEPDWERFMARNLLGVEPIEIRGGHFPMLEDPDALAALLDDLASG